ncbi:hypothetical protein ABZS83_30675 [Streptomyces sp. NPDC005426]|uniref:hypothetical protein n=1 Tax=Streptomyces sp. NPDC005426 TaxID=3155344 RepID=UPI0033AC25E3
MTQIWLWTTLESERAAQPIADYELGPDWLASIEAMDQADRREIIEATVDVVTRRAAHKPSRDVHSLRSHTAGGAPRRRRADNATAMRCSIKKSTPAAARLMWWVRPEQSLELGRVALARRLQAPLNPAHDQEALMRIQVPELRRFPIRRAQAIGAAHLIEQHHLRRVVAVLRDLKQAEAFACRLAVHMLDAEILCRPPPHCSSALGTRSRRFSVSPATVTSHRRVRRQTVMEPRGSHDAAEESGGCPCRIPHPYRWDGVSEPAVATRAAAIARRGLGAA